MDKARVFAALRGGVECKTHKSNFNLKKHKFCFVAKEAVTFLVQSGIVKNRTDGLRVCNAFLKEDLINHVSSSGKFEDDGSYYRFCVKISNDYAKKVIAKIEPRIEVKNRKLRLSTYRECFLGSALVDQLVVAGIAKDRNEASQIGNALMRMTPPYIEHVTGSRFFEDDNIFYRFVQVKPVETELSQFVESKKTSAKFTDNYVRGEKLGEGAFSVVVSAKKKSTGQSYAIKIVTKSKLSVEDEEALKDEIQVLQELTHKNIIRLYEVFDETLHYYLVTEHMMGGELFDRIVQKAFYNEKDARDVCKILFEALAYCHSKKIAHRDLKPENLLLVSKEDDRQLKIADFGFAKKAPEPMCLKTQCGTPGYVAPEILEGVLYGTQADMWSLGVITYILLGGYPPFIEKDQKQLFRKIRKGDFEFHPQYWSNVSQSAKTLIGQLLTVDPARRINAMQALKDPWMLRDDKLLANMDLGVNLAEFKRFNAGRKFRGAVQAVIMMNKMESLGEQFRENLYN